MWEYKRYVAKADKEPHEWSCAGEVVWRKIDRDGEEGWELVEVVPIPGKVVFGSQPGSNRFLFILKREKPPPL